MGGPCVGCNTVETADVDVIDYKTYRFGRASQLFRGPQPDLNQPYISYIGGTETYGRFVPNPFPKILAHRLGVQSANWGTPGAGPTFFLKDPVVLEACSQSRVCVISAMGAVPMSNRLYSVFKRRNCRLLDTSETLRALYPELDLSEFRFVHNMLRRMYRVSSERFRMIEIELRQAWVARMRDLMDDIETIRVLLWMSSRQPEDVPATLPKDFFTTSPAFVTRDMFEQIVPHADLVVEYVPDAAVAADREDGRVYDRKADQSAILWPGPTMHMQTAELLEEPLREIISQDRLIGKMLRG